MKPLASLSLDLDNRWSYLKTRGIDSWRELPSYLDLVVPRFLRFFEERDLRVTVFVVGQDAALPQNRHLLRGIADAGHEIANHSFHHEPWLHLYSEDKIEEEIRRAEEAIEQATGQRTVGFRGPGYSLSESTLRVLVRRGYHYDASTLPTYIGPLARAYYFFRSPLNRKDREQRSALFGTWRDGRRPLKPYRWSIDGQTLLELPVTVMPVLRSPFHPSYLLYLSSFSTGLAYAYFRAALGLCRQLGVTPSVLLHPLDFLDAREVPDLAFFPAMGLESVKKLAIVGRLLQEWTGFFDLVPTRELGQKTSEQELSLVSPEAAGLPRAHVTDGGL
jgi:peptidoglycan-N-acetylglucosamine deacetylase